MQTSVISADSASPRGASSDAAGAFERRVAWLEEDVSVLHRRLRDECGEANSAGDSGLRALVAQLDGEQSAERRSREALEARMTHLEDSIRHERKEREAQLRGFSNELETTMRGLIGRIDESLSAGAAAMRERTDATEARLRSLISRVDEGLSAGAAALQDTLCATGALNSAEKNSASLTAPSYSREDDQPSSKTNQGVSDRLAQTWEQLRQEQMRLSQSQRINGHRGSNAAESRSTTAPQSPIPGSAASMQVRGAGLSSLGAGVPSAGYGTRAGMFQQSTIRPTGVPLASVSKS